MFNFFNFLPKISPSGKGFTLVELMIVISIIALLASVGAVTYGNVSKHNRDQKRVRDLQSISQALELYFHDHNSYPGCLKTTYISTNPSPWILACSSPVQPPFDSSYMATIPTDPLNSSPYYYSYEPMSSISSSPVPSCSTATNPIYYVLWTQMETDQPTNDVYGCSSTTVISEPHISGSTYFYVLSPQ